MEIKNSLAGQIRMVVLDLVVLELERLSRRGSSNLQTWANAALTLLTERGYLILEHKSGPTDVDMSLVQLALTEKTPTAIATIDKQLRSVLKSFEIAAISPKARYGLITTNFHH